MHVFCNAFSVYTWGQFFLCYVVPARAMHSPIKLSGRESISWNFGAAFNDLYRQDQQMKKGRAELTHHLGSATDTVAATQSGSLSGSQPNPTRVVLRKRVVTFVAWDRVRYEQWWVTG